MGLVDRLNILSQVWRGRLFRPILFVLTQAKITADRLTNFRLILGIVAVYFYFFTDRQNLAVGLWLTAIILDVLDGSLARYQNKASDRGKFLDVFVDNILFCFLLFFILDFSGSIFLVFYNLFILPIVYLLAIIKKQEFLPSDWLIKPYPKVTYVKAVVLVAFLFCWYCPADLKWLNYALVASNILATGLSVYFWAYIQWRWKKMGVRK
ncbi:MAG: CDP-alcohol phosphatidyltransferase family protein [Patescibacteria group bacterium]|nr:CDP-alcohol phosphatidyltransferase family protein [Patescibacteria group bacterium]